RSVVGDQIGFPGDLSGLGVERVHAPAAFVTVAAGIADEDQALPSDGRGGEGFTPLWIGDALFPQFFPPCPRASDAASVLKPAEQRAVEIGGASVHGERAFDVLVDAPFLLAGAGVDGEGFHLGGAVKVTADDDGAGLEAGVEVEVVDAELLEAGDVGL